MGKRTIAATVPKHEPSKHLDADSDIDVSSSDSEPELDKDELVNVDFDYFDVDPEVDFMATKTFLTQLFGEDSTRLDILGIADLIMSLSTGGTTIKTDGKTSDPLAMLAVLSLDEHRLRPCVKGLIDYIFEKTLHLTSLNMTLRKLLEKQEKQEKPVRVGWVFCERIINMPVEVVPPMYRMLIEDVGAADEAHEEHEYDFFVIVSKVYELVAGKEEAEDAGPRNKKKRAAAEPEMELDYFHYEDLVLEQNAMYKGYGKYTNEGQDTDLRRVFTEYGIRPRPSFILMDREALVKSVPQMQEKFPPF